MAGAKSSRFSVTSGDVGRQIDGRDIGPYPPPILGAEVRSLPWKRRAKTTSSLCRLLFFDLAVSEIRVRASALSPGVRFST